MAVTHQVTDCLFCKLIRREIPAELVHQDEKVTVFKDINPQAPTHLLIISNTHTESHLETNDAQLYLDVMEAARNIAKRTNLTDYRLVMNNGAGAGQSVFHMHLHLLAGRSFQWPPG